METKNYVSLWMVDSLDSMAIQYIRLGNKLMLALKARNSDYLQLNLEGGGKIIASMIPYHEAILSLGKITIYPASVSNCVTISGTESLEDCCIELEDVDLLAKVAIRKIELDIKVKSMKYLLKYTSNKKLFVSLIKRTLSKFYGVVNNCTISLKTNTYADCDWCGLESIYVRSIEFCEGCTSANKKRSHHHRGFVGCGFYNGNCRHEESIDELETEDEVIISSIKSIEDEDAVESFGGMQDSLLELEQLVTEEESNQLYILTGPEGSGKCSLVKKLSEKLNVELISIDCLTLISLKTKDAQTQFVKKCSEARELSEGLKVLMVIRRIDEWCSAGVGHFNILIRNIDVMLYHKVIVIATSTSYDVQPELEQEFDVIQMYVGESSLEYRAGVVSAMAGENLSETDVYKLAAGLPAFVAKDIKHLFKMANEEHYEEGKTTSSEYLTFLEAASKTFQPTIIKSSTMIGDRPNSSPLAGMEDLVGQLTLIIANMISEDDTIERLTGISKPKGLILYGPHGCGKTQLMCGLADQLGCTFMVVQPREILSSFVGETEKNLVKCFWSARNARPTIIFMDEIDGLFGDRRARNQSAVRLNLLTELLQLMDGVNSPELMKGVMVCGATNNPEKLDPALLRPGRFDRLEYVGLPNEKQRKLILEMKCKGTLLEDPEVLSKIALQTENFTGAELEEIARNAVNYAIVNGCATDDKVCLKSDNLLECARKTVASTSKDLLAKYEAFKVGK